MDVVVLCELRNSDVVHAVVAGVVSAASEFLCAAHLPPAVLPYTVVAMELAVGAAEPCITQFRPDGVLSWSHQLSLPDTKGECSVEQLPFALSRGSLASQCVSEIAIGGPFVCDLSGGVSEYRSSSSENHIPPPSK